MTMADLDKYNDLYFSQIEKKLIDLYWLLEIWKKLFLFTLQKSEHIIEVIILYQFLNLIILSFEYPTDK